MHLLRLCYIKISIRIYGIVLQVLLFWSKVDLQCCINFWYTAKQFVCIWTYILYVYRLHILFHNGLSQDIIYNSLCYTGPCCLSCKLLVFIRLESYCNSLSAVFFLGRRRGTLFLRFVHLFLLIHFFPSLFSIVWLYFISYWWVFSLLLLCVHADGSASNILMGLMIQLLNRGTSNGKLALVSAVYLFKTRHIWETVAWSWLSTLSS